MEVKVCKKCLIEKPLNEFYSDKRNISGVIGSCKQCYNINQKKWKESNPDKCRNWVLNWQKNNPEKVNWSKVKNDDNFKDASKVNDYLLDNQRATNYFSSGSGGREKSAFLAEVQQYMMDKGIIPKTSYTQVTPEMVKNTFNNAIIYTKSGFAIRIGYKASSTNYNVYLEGRFKQAGVQTGAVDAKKFPEEVLKRYNYNLRKVGEPNHTVESIIALKEYKKMFLLHV